MPIIKKDHYFGEGIATYGEADPAAAFKSHLEHVRNQRVIDAIGKDAQLNPMSIVRKFQEIQAAMEAADEQVAADNKAFMTKHALTI